jgi:hypothetical protein
VRWIASASLLLLSADMFVAGDEPDAAERLFDDELHLNEGGELRRNGNIAAKHRRKI